jgi:hypothetical protein
MHLGSDAWAHFLLNQGGVKVTRVENHQSNDVVLGCHEIPLKIELVVVRVLEENRVRR